MTSSDEKVLRIPMKDHLWEWSLPTDVTFVFHVFQGAGTKQRKHMHDVVFPAHRDLLITASPYFERLLAGDWKPTDEVSIEDCQPGAFRILLRWIYGDEDLLDSVHPSTFIPLLLAAERFDVKGVVSRLVNHAVLILAVTDSFLYEILDMLEHCQIGCANELIE
ncbi:BTB/POZ domain-containing protein 6, partial [Aphelenchoides avenae]